MKKKYTIYCTVTYSSQMTVEAENMKEAHELADEKLDNMEFPDQVNGFDYEYRATDHESIVQE